MEEKDLISKKELLQLTGISYGQLYRWKRENLIPEAWFVKKASFTGQETFFPKDKILERTNRILELKDKYSLEELGNIFSPESTNRIFKKSDIEDITEIKANIVEVFINVFQKERFNFIELTFIYIVGKLNSEGILKEENILNIVSSINSWSPDIKDTSYIFLICKNEIDVFTILLKQDAVYYLDCKTKKLKEIRLDEAAKELNEIINII
jgi:DNA-binding transcriptional MerR regulator